MSLNESLTRLSLLCATSASSVVDLLVCNNHHRDTENTEVAQRNPVSDFKEDLAVIKDPHQSEPDEHERDCERK